MRSWDLRTGEDVQELALHRDYVLSMTARAAPSTGGGLLVTGGAADHLVILCDTEDSGGIKCRHKMSGDLTVSKNRSNLVLRLMWVEINRNPLGLSRSKSPWGIVALTLKIIPLKTKSSLKIFFLNVIFMN